MINLEEKLTEADIQFELYHHQAIYTNEDAVIMKEEKGFTGTETKSLYLKGKDGRYYIFLTFTTKRTNFKEISKIVGTRLSVVSGDEMEEQTGQKPGAVSPFGYENNVPIIIDEELLEYEKLVFAPGKPDSTMVIRVEDLDEILDLLDIKKYLYSEE